MSNDERKYYLSVARRVFKNNFKCADVAYVIAFMRTYYALPPKRDLNNVPDDEKLQYLWFVFENAFSLTIRSRDYVTHAREWMQSKEGIDAFAKRFNKDSMQKISDTAKIMQAKMAKKSNATSK